MIKYWSKLMRSSDSFIPKKMYGILKDDADSGITYNGTNWASCIKSKLDTLGISYIWLQQGEIDIPLSLIKQRIFDHFYQTLYTDINNSNRLITYARYKQHEFNCVNYLDFTANNKCKVAFTRFRLSSHDLQIDRGRYENIARAERIFKCCNMSKIENKYHFLLVCPLYAELKRKFLSHIFATGQT